MTGLGHAGGRAACVPVVSVGGGSGGSGGGASLLRSRLRSFVVGRAGAAGAPASSVEFVVAASDELAGRAIAPPGSVAGSDVITVEDAAASRAALRVMRMRSWAGGAPVDEPVTGSVPATEPDGVLPIGARFPSVKLVVVSTPVPVESLTAVAVVEVPSPRLVVTVPLAPSCTTSYCCCCRCRLFPDCRHPDARITHVRTLIVRESMVIHSSHTVCHDSFRGMNPSGRVKTVTEWIRMTCAARRKACTEGTDTAQALFE